MLDYSLDKNTLLLWHEQSINLSSDANHTILATCLPCLISMPTIVGQLLKL